MSGKPKSTAAPPGFRASTGRIRRPIPRALWRLGLLADVFGLADTLDGLAQPSPDLLHLAFLPLDVFGLAVAIAAWLGSRYGRGPVGRRASIGGVWLTTAECVAGSVGYFMVLNTVPVSVPGPNDVTISYEVTGSAPGAAVEFQSDLGMPGDDPPTTEQVTLPWHSTVMVLKSIATIGDFTVTATLGGTVTCTVTIDGRIVKTATVSGFDLTADCAGDPTIPSIP